MGPVGDNRLATFIERGDIGAESITTAVVRSAGVEQQTSKPRKCRASLKIKDTRSRPASRQLSTPARRLRCASSVDECIRPREWDLGLCRPAGTSGPMRVSLSKGR